MARLRAWQVGPGAFVQLQRAGGRVDDLHGGVVVAAMFQPQVVIRAAADGHRQLTKAQPRGRGGGHGDDARPLPLFTGTAHLLNLGHDAMATRFTLRGAAAIELAISPGRTEV